MSALLVQQSKWNVSYLRTWFQLSFAKLLLYTVLSLQLFYKINSATKSPIYLQAHLIGNKQNTPRTMDSQSASLSVWVTWFVAYQLALLDQALHLLTLKLLQHLCQCWLFKFSVQLLVSLVWSLVLLWLIRWSSHNEIEITCIFIKSNLFHHSNLYNRFQILRVGIGDTV